MQSLEDFGTRYARAPNRFEIANWVKDEFLRFGFSDVDLDSFENNILPEDGPFYLGSDSVPFADRGFPTIFFFEHEFNPNYHEPTDLVIHCNMDYCAEVTKASCATLIGNIVMPKEVDNFTVTDKGNGSSLVLNWSANKDDDMVGYNVYAGILLSNYDTVFTTSDTSLVLKDLVEGTQYYIGITVYDSDRYESLINEKNGIPNSIPLAPVGLSEKALWHAVEINWLNNLELDLFGYNIYRSTPSTEDTLLRLNTSVLTDIFFIDTSPCVSLDQGILVIDETSDGDGRDKTGRSRCIFNNNLAWE